MIVLIFIISSLEGITIPLFMWFNKYFGITYRELVFTVRAPLKGANVSFFKGGINYCLPGLILSIIIDCLLLYSKSKILQFVALMVLLLLLVIFLIIVEKKLKILDYFRLLQSQTKIYENFSVNIQDDDIEEICEARNLIYIIVESLEVTYASKEDGGFQEEINYIPNCTKLAKENISFSNSKKLGGFLNSNGTGWTMAAIFASQTGLPYSVLNDSKENLGKRKSFIKNAVALGDILHKKGYEQEFLCGSDANFGGRRAFFEQHGEYMIFDKFNAKDKGYVKDFVSWGVEDYILYSIAKDELTRLSNNKKPFNLTMLTVDTHHVGGWICPVCDNKYDDKLGNVVACADKQLGSFIEWCKTQPWFDNTTIVIQGDHPRMDTCLVDGVDMNERAVYNCFINSVHKKDAIPIENRIFLAMDMMPTTLSALGYKVPEERIGLGTNLFSDKPTLTEELGYAYVNTEIGKYSKYYIDNFV